MAFYTIENPAGKLRRAFNLDLVSVVEVTVNHVTSIRLNIVFTNHNIAYDYPTVEAALAEYDKIMECIDLQPRPSSIDVI